MTTRLGIHLRIHPRERILVHHFAVRFTSIKINAHARSSRRAKTPTSLVSEETPDDPTRRDESPNRQSPVAARRLDARATD